MTPAERESVVAEARSWVGTPYHSNASLKGIGCDCALGPLAIYRAALPRLPDITPTPYVEQWHLHRGEELYLHDVRALGGVEVASPEPGDFVLFRQGRLFSHGAIVLGWPEIVHATVGRGFVYADAAADPKLKRAERIYFTL